MNEDTKKKLAALAALNKKKPTPKEEPTKKVEEPITQTSKRLEALNKVREKQKVQPQVTVAPIQKRRTPKRRGRPTQKNPEEIYKKVTVRLPELVVKNMKMALLTTHTRYGTQDEFIREAVLHFLKLQRGD